MPYSYNHKFSLQLATSSTLGIAATQSGTGGTTLTINGGLASGGVATLDVPRRVVVTSASNDSNKTFTITGTDYWGNVQTEVLTGGNSTTVATLHDFATVSSIIPSASTAGNVSAGTNSTGSTPPWVIDQWSNPQVYGVGTITSGTVTYSMEKSYDNYAPSWNVNFNTPTYYIDANFSGLSGNTNNQIQGPLTMLRLTITSGTGSVVANAVQAAIFGPG